MRSYKVCKDTKQDLGATQMRESSKKVQERKLKLCGHLTRREEHCERRPTVLEVQGRSRGGRPKRRPLDRVRDDIREKRLSGKEVYD